VIGDVLTGLLIVAIGVTAIRYHGSVERGFRRAHEWIYERLPRIAGKPLLKASPAMHAWMGFVVFGWGCVCVLSGALIVVYAVVG
jgi:hypothetical protein